MKRLFSTLVILFVVSVSGVSAQQKGDVYASGSLGFGVTSVIVEGDSATAAEFAIEPSVGYFVADKFMVGFGLGYSVAGGDGTTHTLTLGPKVSYFVSLGEKLYYTPSLDVLFCYASTEGFGIPGFGLGVNLVGFEYQPTERIGLTASMLSLDYVMLSKDGLTLNTVDFGLTFSPSVGFKYYF